MGQTAVTEREPQMWQRAEKGRGMSCVICLAESVFGGNQLRKLETLMREAVEYLHLSNKLKET